MKLLDNVRQWWKKSPPRKLVPPARGYARCDRCLEDVNAWRTHADGETVCLPCAQRRKRK